MIGRDAISVVLACLVLSVVAGTAIVYGAKRIGVVAPVLAGTALRIVSGLGQFTMIGFAADARTYDDQAIATALRWSGVNTSVEITTGKEGWPTLLAIGYRSVGYAPELGIVANIWAGSATILLVALVAHLLNWKPTVRISAWIVALWPVAVIWGPLLLREAITTLLISVALVGAVLLHGRAVALGAFLVALAGGSMMFMRGGLAILILLVLPLLVLAATFAPSAGKGRTRALVTGLTIGALAIPILALRIGESQYFDRDRILVVAQALDQGATSFASAGVTGGQLTVPTMVHVAAGPLPWNWNNLGLLATGLDAVLWIGLYLLALLGARSSPANRWALLVLLVPPIALTAYLAQGATNFGLIMRVRTMNLPFIVPVAALGLVVMLERRRRANTATAHHELPHNIGERQAHHLPRLAIGGRTHRRRDGNQTSPGGSVGPLESH